MVLSSTERKLTMTSDRHGSTLLEPSPQGTVVVPIKKMVLVRASTELAKRVLIVTVRRRRGSCSDIAMV